MGQGIADIQQIADSYRPIGLQEMDAVQLLNRMDTKFLISIDGLAAVLNEVSGAYRCLQVNGMMGADYKTLYYDTPDLDCYFDHHNGRIFRNKVRKREYVGSDLCFLEVKRKTGSGRTDKVRTRISEIEESLKPEERSFVQESVLRGSSYEHVLWNSFRRYTLVHNVLAERLTIDVDLRFERNGQVRSMGEVAICELKQERVNMHTDFYRAMRTRGVRPAGMSKYCLGMILLNHKLKRNRFKPTLLKLDRIQNAA